MRGIRFIEGDLSDRGLPARLGEFDLVTCQGVLSYVPNPSRALRNLRRCLGENGVLYLGVNGLGHTSTRIRPALRDFGYDLNAYSEGTRLGRILRLCDVVLGAAGLPQVVRFGASYLASDVFGAMNACLSLAEWKSHASEAGLHLRGNLASARIFSRLTDDDLYLLLAPRSREQVCEILEHLCPSPFHQLLLSKRRESNPPWRDKRGLVRFRVARTQLYHFRLPRIRGRIRDRLRKVAINDLSRGVSIESRMPEWQIGLLRFAKGRRALSEFLRECPLTIPFTELSNQLFLLYQLGAVNLLPPPTD